MLRYALRNKSKIVEKLGLSFLDVLKQSLDKYFKENDKVEEHVSDPYNFISVPSSQPYTETVYKFYVTRKVYDVYNLAYKSSEG